MLQDTQTLCSHLLYLCPLHTKGLCQGCLAHIVPLQNQCNLRAVYAVRSRFQHLSGAWSLPPSTWRETLAVALPLHFGLWCKGAVCCLVGLWEISPALSLLRVVLSVEDRLLLKIKVPKALLRWWWMLRGYTLSGGGQSCFASGEKWPGLSLVLPSMAHNWARRACPGSPFPLWYSAAYHYEAMEAGVCTGRLEHVCHREGSSRLCMAVAGPNRVEEGRTFFSRAANSLFFRKTDNREHLAGPAKSCCQAQYQSCRWKDYCL